MKPATDKSPPEGGAFHKWRKASYEKDNHSRMPDLSRYPRICGQFGGRIAERTGSRSGSGEREPRRTHGASRRQDRSQEGPFLLQSLGREGPQGGSGSQARRSDVLNARRRREGRVPPACSRPRHESWAVRLPRAILGLLRKPRIRAIDGSVGGVRRRSDRPKQPRINRLRCHRTGARKTRLQCDP